MAIRLLALFSYGGSYYVLSVTRHLDFSIFLGVSSAILDDDVFLLLMTGFEEDCLLFISRVPYYILINKRGRCT